MGKNRGFSLIELLVVLSILAVVLALAVPAMSDYLDRRKIISAAEAIYGELQYARAEAIARSATVYTRFSVDAGIWSIGVSTTNNCDPTETVVTEADACVLVVDNGDGVNDSNDLVRHVISSGNFPGVTIDSISVAQTAFNPRRGTASPGATVTLGLVRGANQGSYEMRVILGLIGRVRICTPTGNEAVAGYTSC